MKKCKKCGNEIEDDKIFCEKCGTGEKIKKEKKKKDKKKTKSKKLIIIITIVIIAVVFGIILIINANSFESKIEKLINSGETEVIFLDRNNATSRDVKSILDNELKEQGITSYTTIDAWNLSSKEMDYLMEKFHVVNDNCTLYLKVLKGSENITGICESEATKDTIMYYFGRENLLNDSEKIVNEHFYNLGKTALDNGFLGQAKENLEKCSNYSPANDLLNDKRFLIFDKEFEYRVENISRYGYNLIYSVKYYGGYKADTFMIYKFECQGAYNCLLTEGETTFYDAKILDNKIYIKEKNESSFNKYYTIEKLTDNQLKLEQIDFTMTKK